jgi:hypothetical protein
LGATFPLARGLTVGQLERTSRLRWARVTKLHG